MNGNKELQKDLGFTSEADQIDPAEWDACNLFTALCMNQEEQRQLVSAWQQCAPGTQLADFTRALVNGGAKLSMQLEP